MLHRGLGRGLSALIPKRVSAPVVPPTAPVADEAEERILHVPTEQIAPNPQQPRQDFNHEGMEELVASVKQHGILQPLVATRLGAGYQLIVGERRLRAAKILQLPRVPVIVRDVQRQQQLELALIENIQRQNLNPLEEATAYQRLFSEFNCTQDVMAQRLGKSRSAIANTMRLVHLPEEIKQALVAGKISAGSARVLVVVPADQQTKLFRKALRENWTVRVMEAAARITSVRHYVRKNTDPQVLSYQQQLEQALGTRVRIKKSGTSGHIVLHFFSEEELASLVLRLTNAGDSAIP